MRINGIKESKGIRNIGKKNLFIVAALAALLLIGSSLAYFADRNEVTNHFVVGDVKVEIEEPSWNAEDGINITPKKVINKDPQINNTGENDAYVFMSVKVPRANVAIAENDGTPNDASPTDLFTYRTNTGWTLIKTNIQSNVSEYVYAYTDNQGELKVLSPTESTNALFNTVKFINMVEGELNGQDADIVLTAYAIQSDDLTSERASDVYNIIVKQSGEQ